MKGAAKPWFFSEDWTRGPAHDALESYPMQRPERQGRAVGRRDRYGRNFLWLIAEHDDRDVILLQNREAPGRIYESVA